MPTPPRKRSYGCFYIIAAVIAVLVVYDLIQEAMYEPREYVEPINSKDVIAQYAAQQLNQLQAKSFADGVEYCGMIYENSEGTLSTSEVFKGDDGTCDFHFEYGGALNPVASFHTHGGYDVEYDNEAPSLIDIEEDIKNQVDGYIATPGGRLWRVDWREEYAEQVCGERCLTQDPDYRPCPAYPVKAKYTTRSLESRIDNDPDRC